MYNVKGIGLSAVLREHCAVFIEFMHNLEGLRLLVILRAS